MTGFDGRDVDGCVGMETAAAAAGVGLVRAVGFSTALTRLSRESTEDRMRSRADMIAASIGSTGGGVRAGGGRVLMTLSAAIIAGTGFGGETAI
jgi:hypothetical protein